MQDKLGHVLACQLKEPPDFLFILSFSLLSKPEIAACLHKQRTESLQIINKL